MSPGCRVDLITSQTRRFPLTNSAGETVARCSGRPRDESRGGTPQACATSIESALSRGAHSRVHYAGRASFSGLPQPDHRLSHPCQQLDHREVGTLRVLEGDEASHLFDIDRTDRHLCA